MPNAVWPSKAEQNSQWPIFSLITKVSNLKDRRKGMLPKTSSSLIAGWQHESKLYFFQVYLTTVFKFALEPIFPNEVFFFQICE